MENWSLFFQQDHLTIYQQFAGEIRFGPTYLLLKMEQFLKEFSGKIYDDWFYQTSDGLLLQEWNF